MMRSYYRNILLAATLLSTSAACTKEVPGTSPLDGVPISISATAPETKAMLTETTFQTSGNKIQVYDFVTSGTTTTKHIDDYVIAPKSEDPEYHWPFGSGTKHQWTAGTHKFFGWLKEDANMTSTADAAANTPDEFFGSDFKLDEANHTLTIPVKEMTANTPQFDFMYSDVHTRDMDNDPYYSAVPLKFSHLFSAVSFGIINDSKSNVTLYEFTVTLYNSMSATINFSGDTPVVTYSKSQTGTFRSYTANAGYSIAGQTRLPNAFKADDNAREYILLWPHSESDLNNCSITVRFKLEQNDYTEEESLSLPVSNLEAGNKYHFDVSFVDKGAVKINYLVVDWKTIENEVTFE